MKDKLQEALAHLRTIAESGGTAQQMRDLAAKGIERVEGISGGAPDEANNNSPWFPWLERRFGPSIAARIIRETIEHDRASRPARPSPTDSELATLASEFMMSGSCSTRYYFDDRGFARALLARYGATPAASAEPVAFYKDGVLFWHGEHAAWRGKDGELYAGPPAASERAPVGDERAAFDEAWERSISKALGPRTAAWLAWHERAALASAPVAGEARKGLPPAKCPITGRPFFMALEHPELGMVPTYGGPYDSYTIPHLDGKPDQPWHERELRVYRYDHDLGGWRTDEVEVLPLRIINEDVLHGLEDAAPQASTAADERDAKDAARMPAKMTKHESCGSEYPSSDSYKEGYAEGWNDAIDAAIAAQQGEGGK